MNIRIEPSWHEKLKQEFDKPYFKKLVDFVHDEYTHQEIYPASNNIFNAFNCCPFEKVKVVILGQDPYHDEGQAHGLSFSVQKGIPLPPSLRNIYKERESDLGISPDNNGDLTRWAQQGILLLNATLTVRAHCAGSHQGKGWESFTDAVIQQLNKNRKNIVYILWGSYAQKKGAVIDSENNLIIKAPHPSPLSAYRGFFGSNPFSKTNTYLQSTGQEIIEW